MKLQDVSSQDLHPHLSLPKHRLRPMRLFPPAPVVAVVPVAAEVEVPAAVVPVVVAPAVAAEVETFRPFQVRLCRERLRYRL